MKINGIDSAEYGAQQWNVTPGYVSIKNESEMLDGALRPLMLPGKISMKKYKVAVLLRGASRQEMWTNGSRLVASLLSPAVVKLDGFKNNFCFVLTNPSQAESSLKRFHKATLELQGYEYGDEVVINKAHTDEFFAENPGTLETPVTLEIQPEANVSELTIKGLSRTRIKKEEKEIRVRNLRSGEGIVIDSSTGLITTDTGGNKFADVEMWEFPSILPGENFVELSNEAVRISIRFCPLYM